MKLSLPCFKLVATLSQSSFLLFLSSSLSPSLLWSAGATISSSSSSSTRDSPLLLISYCGYGLPKYLLSFLDPSNFLVSSQMASSVSYSPRNFLTQINSLRIFFMFLLSRIFTLLSFSRRTIRAKKVMSLLPFLIPLRAAYTCSILLSLYRNRNVRLLETSRVKFSTQSLTSHVYFFEKRQSVRRKIITPAFLSKITDSIRPSQMQRQARPTKITMVILAPSVLKESKESGQLSQ